MGFTIQFPVWQRCVLHQVSIAVDRTSCSRKRVWSD